MPLEPLRNAVRPIIIVGVVDRSYSSAVFEPAPEVEPHLLLCHQRLTAADIQIVEETRAGISLTRLV